MVRRMIVKPFRGLRPPADRAERVASVPYDTVDRAEAARLAEGNPDSFLRVVRAEIELDAAVDPYDPHVYARARENLERLVRTGGLARDPRPAYYVYRLAMDGRVQTGAIGAAAVADYREGRVKKHEFTRPAKEDDRVRLNRALSAHPGPVFLTYRPDATLDGLIAREAGGRPAADFTAVDGVRHTLWVVDEPARVAVFAAAFAAIPATYVADGHHRTAAAARVGEMFAAERAGDGPWNYFLAVHFPADALHVLDYNRVVRDLAGRDAGAFLAAVREAGFRVATPHAGRRPPRAGTFGMYLAGTWHLLEPDPKLIPVHDPVRRLDVAVLSDRLLEPLLGIADPRTDERIDFVGGIRGMEELERRVDSGRDAVAFAVYPTSIRDVMDVADAGQVMPPKSTWFEPKLRSGLVVQSLEGDAL